MKPTSQTFGLRWQRAGALYLPGMMPNPGFIAGLIRPTGGGGGGGYTQIQTQGNDTDNNGLSTTGGNQILYSSFVTSAGDSITKIRVRFLKVGSPTFNIVLRLYTDSGGSGPTSTQVGADSIETLAASSVTGSYANYDFTFSALSVSNATKYWAAAVASGVGDGSNFIRWSGNPAGTGQQWRTDISLAGGTEVQASMDGSLTTFKTP